jgi:hypothetical protein
MTELTDATAALSNVCKMPSFRFLAFENSDRQRVRVDFGN